MFGKVHDPPPRATTGIEQKAYPLRLLAAPTASGDHHQVQALYSQESSDG
jgi:hypothetical protein